MSSSFTSESQAPPTDPAVLLQDAGELFRLFEDCPTGMILLDRDGIVLRVNALAEQRLGRDRRELVNADLFREAFPELEREGLGPKYRHQSARGAVDMYREISVRTHGVERRLALGIRSLSVPKHHWCMVAVEDRSSLAAEEERRKRAERLAAVGELASGVAHEINNPLSSIQSFAQLLAREAREEEQQRALEIIIRESDRIAQVVENLTRFAHQQGLGGREQVNLNDLVEQVLGLRHYALESAGIEVCKDLDADISPVMGEPGALQQVILNLVVNAEQALINQSDPRRLIIRTRESTLGVMFSVFDNGPGIPKAQLPHIFDAPDASTSPEQPLDLEICATIVREHGGQITAESEQGRGAVFSVRLPRAGTEVVQPHPPQVVRREASPAPRRALRILVADDEATLRLALSLFLKRRGHEVTEAADAFEALRLTEEQDFDVALIDARMPGDGLQLLERLESDPRLQGRTALMTGDLGRARTHLGATTNRPYLIKPFDMTEAVHLVEKLGR